MAELTHVGTSVGLLEMARDAARRVEAGERIEVPAPAPQEFGTSQMRPAPWVPDRFASESFATFQPATNSQGSALAAVQTWVLRTLAGKGDMLALIGTTGAGKSHLLYAAGRALIEEARVVYSRPWYLLADELRYGGRSPFNELVKLEPVDVRDLLWRAKVILIDEVRPTASTAFDDTELAKLACHAYDRRIAMLITTNVSPLSEVVGPAAASRFTQVTITGPDRRQAR